MKRHAQGTLFLWVGIPNSHPLYRNPSSWKPMGVSQNIWACQQRQKSSPCPSSSWRWNHRRSWVCFGGGASWLSLPHWHANTLFDQKVSQGGKMALLEQACACISMNQTKPKQTKVLHTWQNKYCLPHVLLARSRGELTGVEGVSRGCPQSQKLQIFNDAEWS